ncbi:MAG: hypothetical protein OXG60_12120 [Chloroflexi bacterium]|nr:hypothetical protein [Chloroflexota bacterium]
MSNSQFDPLTYFIRLVEDERANGSFQSEQTPRLWSKAEQLAEEARRQYEKQALSRRMQTVEELHTRLASIENAAEIGETEFQTAISEMAEFCNRLAKPASKIRPYSNGSTKSADTYSSGRPIPRLRKLFADDEGVATVAFFRISENGQLFLGDRSNKRNIWFNQDWSVLNNTVFSSMYIPHDGEWVEVPSKSDEFDVEWKRSGRNIHFVRIVD